MQLQLICAPLFYFATNCIDLLLLGNLTLCAILFYEECHVIVELQIFSKGNLLVQQHHQELFILFNLSFTRKIQLGLKKKSVLQRESWPRTARIIIFTRCLWQHCCVSSRKKHKCLVVFHKTPGEELYSFHLFNQVKTPLRSALLLKSAAKKLSCIKLSRNEGQTCVMKI